MTVKSIMTAAAGLVVLLGCGSPGGEPPDAAAAREVVADYLAATGARDERAISALVAPGVNATADISERLDLYGGRRAPAVRYATDFGGQVTDVVITDRSASGSARTEEITLVWEDDHWYLALGEAPRGPADPPRASPVDPDE